MKDNKELFMKEYLCKLVEPSEGYIKAYELWIKYHYECERHDKFICTGPLDRDGFIRPANAQQQIAIIRNARNLKGISINEARKYKLKNEELNKAKLNVNRLTSEGLEREYRRLF